MPRQPTLAMPDEQAFASFEKQSMSPAGSVVLTATVRLITPAVFGGFAPRDPDVLAPIRAKAVRGQLREWWRALAEAGDLDDCGLPQAPSSMSKADRQALEFSLWGALGEEAKGQDSLVGVRVNAPPVLHQRTRQYHPGDQAFEGLQYALHFADAPREDRTIPARHIWTDRSPFQISLTLQVCSRQQAFARSLEVLLYAWACLGGVGGRNSRGIGALMIDSLVRDSGPALAAAPALIPSGPDPLHGACRVSGLRVVNGLLALQNGIGARFVDAASALRWGLGQLSGFMQAPLGRNGANGMSQWPEARLIRHLSQRHFRDPGDPHHHHDPATRPAHLPGGATPARISPRVAFGHRNIRFVSAQVRQIPFPDPGPHGIVPADSDRLLSSLIIRPLAWKQADGVPRYGCLFVQRTAMAGTHLPVVSLKPGQHQATTALQSWDPSWRAGQPGGCANIRPLEDPRCADGVFDNPQDAAQAFINLVFNTVSKGPAKHGKP